MPLSQSPALPLAAHVFATIFFDFAPPSSPADAKITDSLMAVYGARDVFMGIAIYSAALFGTRKSLGWTLVAASGVAVVDGAVCYNHGQGEWNHWGYAPMVGAVGSVLLGLLDGGASAASARKA